MDFRQTKIKNNLQLRAKILQTIRHYFIQHNFLEVETPIRIPAPAPEAHIDAMAAENWYLQTSPELCMKQLLAAGLPNIFQICKCFRKGERGDRHIPELTMLEWYAAGEDYQHLMARTESMIQSVAQSRGIGSRLVYQSMVINLDSPWQRLSLPAAFNAYASVSLEDSLKNDRFEEVLVEEIEPKLGVGKPVFLYDYPAAHGALARLKPADNSLAERFELYIGGLELCNGFSELTDPIEQRSRFLNETALRESMGKTVYPLPEKFLNALGDMPAAAGNALGIDRLVMLFANTAEIGDVVAFIPEEL